MACWKCFGSCSGRNHILAAKNQPKLALEFVSFLSLCVFSVHLSEIWDKPKGATLLHLIGHVEEHYTHHGWFPMHKFYSMKTSVVPAHMV